MTGFEDGSFPFLFSIVLSLAPFLVLAILVLAFRRGDPDPTGRRTYGTYLFVVSFLALFALLFSGFALVDSLTSLAFRNRSASEASTSEPHPRIDRAVPGVERAPLFGFDEGPDPVFPPGGPEGFVIPDGQVFFDNGGSDEADDADIRSAVVAGLLAIVALLVLIFHARATRRLVEEDDFDGSPAWRTYQVYICAVCFVALVIAAGAGAVAAYGVFRAIAPGVADEFNSNERREGLATLVSSGLLAIGALVVFRLHWQRAGGRLAPPTPVAVGGPAPSSAGTSSDPTPSEPPPPPPPDPPPLPPPDLPPPDLSPPGPTPPPVATPEPAPPPSPAPLPPSARARQVLGRWARGGKGQSS